ncbi:MAG TPA: PBP1A family penicillin-binding protein [Candidatus Paceibacterota bacterium]|nr:PBP1A family penicillin-binding protein [Candidatus Paceibacterota bacterium]
MKKLYRRIVRFFHRMPEWLRLSIVGVIALGFFLVGGIIAWAALMPIPAINNFENREVAESTKIYDRTGNVVLYDVHGAVRRTSVPLDQISPLIQKATIDIEDDTFYSNWGFRPLAFLRAFLADLTTGSYEQGGSTITQQVVKNALLTQNKSITRKIQEIILALRLDQKYSKDEILNTYLNENPYGGTIYGVQEAAQYFFGVDAKDVDLAQAAYLAALPQAPTYYSPYGNHRAALDTRKNLVLQRMLTLGDITQEEYDQAKAEQVQFRSESEVGIKAPHFVFYIREYLEQKYGVDAVDQGGLRVFTTLDYDLQQKAEEVVAKWAPQMQTNFNAGNEGMVAVEPSSGQILAMVGSRDFSNSQYGQVNVTLALRQPGSSFKPFVYATALKEGYTPDTVVFDLPTQFSTACAPTDNLNDTPPCYSPGNFDGSFKGPIKMRDALAISENIPAVKFLYLAGIDNSIATAVDLGITTLADAARYGLTLVLGGGEVNLLEMTGAYGVFANDGVKNPPTGILRIEDHDGNVLEEYQNQATRVLDPQIARQVNDMLSDNNARIPEFGADSPLYFPGYNVADKTGTTNDFHDVWIIGYTPGISIGAWAGNNDNAPMAKKIAAFIIAPMWHDFMAYALQKYPAANDFVPPAPETDSLPPVLRGEWNTNPAQGVHDILYWTQKGNPRAGAPANPYSDPQTAAWDYPVSLWAAGQNMGGGTTQPGGTQGGSASGFAITSPIANSYVQPNLPLPISANYPDPTQVTSIQYVLNGSAIGTATAAPYTIVYTPVSRGQAVLQAIAHFTNGTTQTAQITFTIQ